MIKVIVTYTCLYTILRENEEDHSHTPALPVSQMDDDAKTTSGGSGGSAASAGATTAAAAVRSDPSVVWSNRGGSGANRVDPLAGVQEFPTGGYRSIGRRKLDDNRFADGYRCCTNPRTTKQTLSMIRELAYTLAGDQHGKAAISLFGSRRHELAAEALVVFGKSRVRFGRAFDMDAALWTSLCSFINQLAGTAIVDAKYEETVVEHPKDRAVPPRPWINSNTVEAADIAVANGFEKLKVSPLCHMYASAMVRAVARARTEQRAAWEDIGAVGGGRVRDSPLSPTELPSLGEPLRMVPYSTGFGDESALIHILHFTLDHRYINSDTDAASTKGLVDSLLELLVMRFVLQRESDRLRRTHGEKGRAVVIFNDFKDRRTMPLVGLTQEERVGLTDAERAAASGEKRNNPAAVPGREILSEDQEQFLVALKIDMSMSWSQVRSIVFATQASLVKDFYNKYWNTEKGPSAFHPLEVTSYTYSIGLETCAVVSGAPVKGLRAIISNSVIGSPAIEVSREISLFSPETGIWVPLSNAAAIGATDRKDVDNLFGEDKAGVQRIEPGPLLVAYKKLEYSGRQSAVLHQTVKADMSKILQSTLLAQIGYRNAVPVATSLRALCAPTKNQKQLFCDVHGELIHTMALALTKVDVSAEVGGAERTRVFAGVRSYADAPLAPDERWVSAALHRVVSDNGVAGMIMGSSGDAKAAAAVVTAPASLAPRSAGACAMFIAPNWDSPHWISEVSQTIFDLRTDGEFLSDGRQFVVATLIRARATTARVEGESEISILGEEAPRYRGAQRYDHAVKDFVIGRSRGLAWSLSDSKTAGASAAGSAGANNNERLTVSAAGEVKSLPSGQTLLLQRLMSEDPTSRKGRPKNTPMRAAKVLLQMVGPLLAVYVVINPPVTSDGSKTSSGVSLDLARRIQLGIHEFRTDNRVLHETKPIPPLPTPKSKLALRRHRLLSKVSERRTHVPVQTSADRMVRTQSGGLHAAEAAAAKK